MARGHVRGDVGAEPHELDVQELGFSNFEPWPNTVRVDGKEIESSTLEHSYQASKVLDPWDKRKILACSTPGQAKRLGQTVELASKWESRKISVMANLLRLKFTRGTAIAKKLVETGDARLVEHTTWHDTFWGVCVCDKHKGQGTNWLGVLLMERRSELAKAN